MSQFTLYAETWKGRHPSFLEAAGPDRARHLFEKFVWHLSDTALKVATGRSLEHTLVEIHNEGPVTILLDSEDLGLSRRGKA